MSAPQKRHLRFFAVEKLTLLYILITTIIIVLIRPGLHPMIELLTNRLIILLIMGTLVFISSKKDWMIIRFLRNAFIGGLLVFWYPETFEINRILPNLDHLLANWEQIIFGYQPALVFSQHFKQLWFSETLNMGYFAYYPLIICSGLYFYLTNLKYFQYFYFTILFSFFAYYIFYILFPAAGPQYYFAAIGNNNVLAGIFPNIGNYFNTHWELTPTQTNAGFFENLVESSQQIGERPTAAFPSSHVGVSSLIVLLIIRSRHYKALLVVLPIYLALILSTVYIQAHYVIDVFAGLISAFLLYYVSETVYKFLNHSSISYKPSTIRQNFFSKIVKHKPFSPKS